MQTKALRVAAYFLIGHYVIVTGLELLGKGAPDYFKIAITLAFLAASVAALFRPYKLGWVFVVGYAWYTLNPYLLGTWSIWTAPNLTSAARITASIVLVVINSPLLVALVLVFKPASFASFKPPSDAPRAPNG